MSVETLPSFSTYGRALALRDLGGIALSIGAHRPDERIPTHRHTDEYQWCLALEGAFEERAGTRREDCSSGSLLVRPPDCIHANQFSSQRGLCLNLFPRRPWLMQHELADIADTYVHQRNERVRSLGRELSLELRRSDAVNAAIELLVIELLESATRRTRYEREGRPRWFAIVLDEIEADPSAELRLATLAANAGVSAGHLARTFRAALGKSAGDYIRGRRLQRAANLMSDPKTSLADVAARLGFCDQAHFSRQFKREFGLAPAAYRKQAMS